MYAVIMFSNTVFLLVYLWYTRNSQISVSVKRPKVLNSASAEFNPITTMVSIKLSRLASIVYNIYEYYSIHRYNMCMRIINACVCIQDKLDQLESDEHTILDLLLDSDIVSLLILRLWGYCAMVSDLSNRKE